MKKIIIALVLIVGVGFIVFSSIKKSEFSNEKNRAATLMLGDESDESGNILLDQEDEDSHEDNSNISGSEMVKPIVGCRNPMACNFDETATVNGGMCDYAFWSAPKSSEPSELFPKEFYFVEPDHTVRLNPKPFESKNNTDSKEAFIKVVPKKVCQASGCVALSIIRFSMPAGELPVITDPAFKPTIETKGWVTKKTANAVIGMKACDQAQKPVVPAKYKQDPIRLDPKSKTR